MDINPNINEPSQSEAGNTDGSTSDFITRLVAGPGVSLLLMSFVSLGTWTGYQANNIDPFVLQPPLTEDWWQLPLSTFAHQGVAHLYGNGIMILIFGAAVVISSSVLRYHIFFLGAGITSSVAHVVVTGALGDASSVLGASGAAMALIGYVIVSNDISNLIISRASWGVVIMLVLAVSLALTLWSASLAVANVSHFAGAFIGAFTGYFHLLRTGQ
jgi:membrane associated rhomboid family serine protease